MVLLTKEEAQAVIKNKIHLFEPNDGNPRDTDSRSNSNYALERTKKSRTYKG